MFGPAELKTTFLYKTSTRVKKRHQDLVTYFNGEVFCSSCDQQPLSSPLFAELHSGNITE